ncbi:unnamed protein product [Amaranthus hypochondriacus]
MGSQDSGQESEQRNNPLTLTHAPNQEGREGGSMGHTSTSPSIPRSHPRPRETPPDPKKQDTASEAPSDTEQDSPDQSADQGTLLNLLSLNQKDIGANQTIPGISAHGSSHSGARTTLHIHIEA